MSNSPAKSVAHSEQMETLLHDSPLITGPYRSSSVDASRYPDGIPTSRMIQTQNTLSTSAISRSQMQQSPVSTLSLHHGEVYSTPLQDPCLQQNPRLKISRTNFMISHPDDSDPQANVESVNPVTLMQMHGIDHSQHSLANSCLPQIAVCDSGIQWANINCGYQSQELTKEDCYKRKRPDKLGDSLVEAELSNRLNAQNLGFARRNKALRNLPTTASPGALRSNNIIDTTDPAEEIQGSCNSSIVHQQPSACMMATPLPQNVTHKDLMFVSSREPANKKGTFSAAMARHQCMPGAFSTTNNILSEHRGFTHVKFPFPGRLRKFGGYQDFPISAHTSAQDDTVSQLRTTGSFRDHGSPSAYVAQNHQYRKTAEPLNLNTHGYSGLQQKNPSDGFHRGQESLEDTVIDRFTIDSVQVNKDLLSKIRYLEQKVQESPYLDEFLSLVKEKTIEIYGESAALGGWCSGPQQRVLLDINDHDSVDVRSMLGEGCAEISDEVFRALSAIIKERTQLVRKVRDLLLSRIEYVLQQQTQLRHVPQLEFQNRIAYILNTFESAFQKIVSRFKCYVSNLSRLNAHMDTKPRKGSLGPKQTSILLCWLYDHYESPYANGPEKQELARSTGLEESQVSNWLINVRSRQWRPTVEAMTGMPLELSDKASSETQDIGSDSKDEFQSRQY